MQVFCLVSDAYGGFGGIAAYNRDLLSGLCAHPNVTSVVAIPRKVSGPIGPLPERLDFVTRAAAGPIFYGLALLGNLVRAARSDVIYCAHIHLLPIANLLGFAFRLPVVLAIYGIDAWQPTGRKYTDLLARRSDAVIAISNFTRDRFVNWSGVARDRVWLLPNAVHLEAFGVRDASHGFMERFGLCGKTVILTLGRIVSKERAKGFDEVLDVLPELVSRLPDLIYVIAGDGDYRDTLEEKAKVLGVGEHVVFTGRVDEHEKSELYRAADAFVMPSRGEGFGFVFLEAMACGVPCVASAVDGSRDAVRDGALGALVDPDDRAALKDAIFEALQKPKAIPDGLEYFSFPNFCKRLHSIIDDVVAGDTAKA